MVCGHCRWIVCIGMIAITCAISVGAQNPETLTEEQMRNFLLNAKVISSKLAGKGITGTYRLTLSDGTMTHDAAFQSVDEYRPSMDFANGRREMNFRDSYKYNIAAFELAKLLGIGDMMPVTVERKWNGKQGSLAWWLAAKMDEAQRLAKNIRPPDPEAWNQQIYKMRVFSQLVYDTDRNLGNVLISEDWHLWMIDFSRAFRLYTTLENSKNLVRCDRQLLRKLRQLDAGKLEQKTKNLLSRPEIKGVMERRDRIVAFFEDLIAKKGENDVLYGD
jgi:hypothetical protein